MFCFLCFLYFGLHPFQWPIKYPTLLVSLGKVSQKKEKKKQKKVIFENISFCSCAHAVHAPLQLPLRLSGLMGPSKGNCF